MPCILGTLKGNLEFIMRVICVFYELSDSCLDHESDEDEASSDEDSTVKGAKLRKTTGTEAERQQRQVGYDQKWR